MIQEQKYKERKENKKNMLQNICSALTVEQKYVLSHAGAAYIQLMHLLINMQVFCALHFVSCQGGYQGK